MEESWATGQLGAKDSMMRSMLATRAHDAPGKLCAEGPGILRDVLAFAGAFEDGVDIVAGGVNFVESLQG